MRGFTSRDRRKPIRPGKFTAKQAEPAEPCVDDFIACKAGGVALEVGTTDWIAELPDLIRPCPERAAPIGPWNGKRPRASQVSPALRHSRRDVKRPAATVYGHAVRNVLSFPGTAKRSGVHGYVTA